LWYKNKNNGQTLFIVEGTMGPLPHLVKMKIKKINLTRPTVWIDGGIQLIAKSIATSKYKDPLVLKTKY
jgi:hypothetical protein